LKKKRTQKKDVSSVKILPAFTFNQHTDEDKASKIFDHNDDVDSGCGSSSDSKTSFNSSSVMSSPKTKGTEPDEPESGPRRSPNGYLLPDRLPAGLIITDLCKGRWRIGKSIGLGGFGEVYSATSLTRDEHEKFNPEMGNFVVKVVS
jgi:hypothetical protein